MLDHSDISRGINPSNETVIKLYLFLSQTVSLNYMRYVANYHFFTVFMAYLH
jgi:hypothetical protein